VLCRVFQKTKGDGDGQDSACGASSSPTLTVSSHVMPEQEHHAPCGYYGGFVPQQEDMLPYYGGGPSVDCHGFPGDDAGGALPGFEFGAGPGVAGDGYGFGYFNMAGFDDTTSHGFGGMGFPQGWN
jgi:hypothetical protein